MKDDNLKNLWNMINDKTGISDFAGNTTEMFIKSSSGSIQDKIRNMLKNDLIVKSVCGIALLLTMALYQDTPDVLYISVAGILFLLLMASIEMRILRQFNKISNPALSTRDNLSGLQIFLKRSSSLVALINSSSQILIFVPGLLIYFYFAYGHVKPMTALSFFVFATLCLIGIITSYLRINSQIKFHIKSISVFLADLNDNILAIVSESIEKQRKQDYNLKSLVGLLLIFAFVLFIAVLKSILG